MPRALRSVNVVDSTGLRDPATGQTLGVAFDAVALVQFLSTVPTLIKSVNVASISDDGAGLFTLTWATPFPDSQYAVLGFMSATTNVFCHENGVMDAESCQIEVSDVNGAAVDPANGIAIIVAFAVA